MDQHKGAADVVSGALPAMVEEAMTGLLKPRAYQQEMFEESLRQNIIVVMDTGSGKTQIAILRIQKELENSDPGKLVWFLTPTIALAEQQHGVVCQQLPAYQCRLLSGNDNVSHWSSQGVWDGILNNINIVVSTPQVLLDALSSGFVKLARISLLVVDEAHRCMKENPTNRIMHFYHQARQSGQSTKLPKILGLTASPAMKPDANSVKQLEENLHAMCRTPATHRDELLRHTHKPEVSTITYQSNLQECSELLKQLDSLLALSLADINNDPYVMSLRKRQDWKSQAKLEKILDSGKTFCRQELISLNQRARVIHSELGSWAADVFVATSVERFLVQLTARTENGFLGEWDASEKLYLGQFLSQLTSLITRRWGSEPTNDTLSQKVKLLIQSITDSYNEGSRVIIFAEQRTTVIILAHLLSVHPSMAGIVTGHFLGSSNHAKRKSNITELSTPREQKDTLNDLRVGKKSILVATSVLEEGIDVPACNMVVCFDPPKELRSFIQRRGRARDKESKLIMFMEERNMEGKAKWTTMEEQLTRIYSDNMRLLEEMDMKENSGDEEDSRQFFRIETTEAVLNHQNAPQYLAHFCATVNCDYADNQPEYHLLPVSTRNGIPEEFSAKVLLPSFLDPSLREATAKSTWKTEKRAKKDAAFQAYLALYREGLVNDNLMPVHNEKYGVVDDDAATQKHASLVQASECLNPWADIAQLRRCHETLVPTRVCFESSPLGRLDVPQMVLLLPRYLPVDLTFDLFWNDQITLKVRLSRDNTMTHTDVNDISEFSHELMFSVFHSRMPSDGHDFITLFWPGKSPSDAVKDWLLSVKGEFAATDIVRECYVGKLQNLGLARHTELYARSFTIERILDTRMAEDIIRYVEDDDLGCYPEEVHLQGTTFPKRTDFLHPIPHDAAAPMHHTAKQCVPISSCSINRLPAMYSRFALFVPSITHKVGVILLAEKLSTTILADVRFENLHLVATAISTSSARESTNYQRFEFLGDSLLKFLTSIHLTAAHPIWHEGLLSSSKDKIVSNNRLSRAALDLGLDQYILTKPFTGRKWRPTYISDLFELGESKTRELSSKLLADVVEALLGASYIDGGFEKLCACLRVFLPELKWGRIDEQVSTMNQAASLSNEVAGLPKLLQMEDIIGYQFTKRSLLIEASTHPCSKDHGVSYQRLEFLGDSVLDHIVVQELFKAPRDLSHQEMHLIRSTLVNADFLAYLCMSLYTTEEREEPEVPGQAHVSMVHTMRKIYLWHFMRHSASWDIVTAQQDAFRRYERCCDQVHEALESFSAYPWALLAQIDAAKFFSDLIESILGAIFVDTHGDLDTCRQFLHHIGLLRYLERILREDIDLLHPRNRLYHAARSDKVDIHTRADKVVNESEGSTVSWTCVIRVNDEDIAELGDGLNKNEVETRTCVLAAAILETRAAEFMDVEDTVGTHFDNGAAGDGDDSG